ncbi:hypothetical protein [Streptomyces venezuelae]|uniref:hypothetical protein n=1 Tax=Streptomyces venezuelae TaxID=54571 RepID=UPI003F4D0DBA
MSGIGPLPVLRQPLPPGYATLAVILAMRRADSSGEATGWTMWLTVSRTTVSTARPRDSSSTSGQA